MIEILKSATFDRWLRGLEDRSGRIRIQARIDRLADGHFGDCKPVGEGVSELRIFHGPGYRLYFIRKGGALIVLLCGGDKTTQQRDIAHAKAIAKDWGD
jgi:putative addiction module killer protein